MVVEYKQTPIHYISLLVLLFLHHLQMFLRRAAVESCFPQTGDLVGGYRTRWIGEKQL